MRYFVWIKRELKPYGPFSFDELQQLVDEGRVLPREDRLRYETDVDWTTFDRVFDFPLEEEELVIPAIDQNEDALDGKTVRLQLKSESS